MFSFDGGLAQCADRRATDKKNNGELEALITQLVNRAVAEHSLGFAQKVQEAEGRLESLERTTEGLHEQVATASHGQTATALPLVQAAEARVDALERQQVQAMDARAEALDRQQRQLSQLEHRLEQLSQLAARPAPEALDRQQQQLSQLEHRLEQLSQSTSTLVAHATDARIEALERRVEQARSVAVSAEARATSAMDTRAQSADTRLEALERRFDKASRQQLEAAAAKDVRLIALERLFVELKSQPVAATADQVEEVGRRLLEMHGWLENGMLPTRVTEAEKQLKSLRATQEGLVTLQRQVRDLVSRLEESPAATHAQVEEVGARLLMMSSRLDQVECAHNDRTSVVTSECMKYTGDGQPVATSSSESTCSDEATRQLGVRVECLERAMQDSGGRLFKAEVACRELSQRSSLLAEKSRVDELATLLSRTETFSQERFDEMAGLVRNMGGQVKVVEASCTDLQKKLPRLAEREHVEAVENKLEDVAACVAPFAPEPGEAPIQSPHQLRKEVQRALGEVVGRVQGVEAACKGLQQGQQGNPGHRLLSRVEELEEALASVSSSPRAERHVEKAVPLQEVATSPLQEAALLPKEVSPLVPLPNISGRPDCAAKKAHCLDEDAQIEVTLEQPGYPPDKLQDEQRGEEPLAPGMPGFPYEGAQSSTGASTWDVAVLVGTESLGRGGSALAGLLVMLTALMQSIFLAVVLESFSHATLVDGDVEALGRWRSGPGRATGGGLALWERACSSAIQPEIASPGKSLASLMESYWGEHLRGAWLASGPALCVVACLCWHAAVLREVRFALGLQRILWGLPRGETRLQPTGDRTLLESVSRTRLAFACVLSIIRLSMAMALAYGGTLFLAATLDASELLLRALALRAILEVGELLLSAAAPQRVAKLAVQLHKARRASPSTSATTSELAAAATRLFALVAGIMAAWFLLIDPQLQAVEASLGALCG